MEKAEQEKGNQTDEKPISLVWDCGSSLYDSFELKSLERQLNSAISSRTLSMPHLSDHCRNHSAPPVPAPAPAPPQPLPTRQAAKRPSKFSKSFQKLVRAIFGPKQSSNSLLKIKAGANDGFYHCFDGTGLYTIPEVAETGGDHGCISPDFNPSLVGRSVSHRFTSCTSIGVSCA